MRPDVLNVWYCVKLVEAHSLYPLESLHVIEQKIKMSTSTFNFEKLSPATKWHFFHKIWSMLIRSTMEVDQNITVPEKIAT